jgi:hypothetical protein
VLGSDSTAVSYAIAAAARKKKPEISIEEAQWNGNTISLAVTVPEGLHGALTVALAEDATHSMVGRGENAGRTLQHVAVVRVMKTIGQNKTNKNQVTLEPGNGKGLTGHAFRLIAFLTDGEGGRVLAVAEVPVTRPQV